MEGLQIIFEVAFRHLWQSALILFVIGGLIFLHKKWSAEHKSWIWTGAFSVMGLMPFLTLLPLPTLPSIFSGKEIGTATQATPLTGVENLYQYDISLLGPFAGTPLSIFLGNALLVLIAIIWVGFSAKALAGLLRSYNKTDSLCKSASAVSFAHRGVPASWPKNISIRQCPEADTPMAVGILNPTVIIPTNLLENLPTEHLSHVLAHELAHIRRGDLLMNFFQQLLLALFWWSPAMRYVHRKLHSEREMACDDRAVEMSGSSKNYATSLIDSAEMIIADSYLAKNAAAVGAFETGDGNFFSKRIKRLINTDYQCGLKLGQSHIGALTIAATLIVGVFILSPRSAFSANASNLKSAELCNQAVDYIYKSKWHDYREMKDIGFDPNCISDRGLTPLIAAAVNDNSKTISWLAEQGADANLAPNKGYTPLMKAAAYGHVDAIKALVKEGANVDQISADNMTAAMVAAKNGEYKSIKYLYKLGADLGIETKVGGKKLSAYKLAKQSEHQKTAELIADLKKKSKKKKEER